MAELPPGWLVAADKAAKSNFTYEADGDGDTWRSHAEAALARRPWSGDCDDLASTALDLLTRWDGNMPLDRLFRLCVASPDCPRDLFYDHMVAGYKDEKGNLFIFGDTFTHACHVSRSPHKVRRYACLSEGIVWRVGQP